MTRISVITPAYNDEAYIRQTIASVVAQTLQDWEYVIVDDGSTDGTAAIVSEIAANDPRVRLVSQPNGGVCAARNNGFAACSKDAEYLLFLDHDDIVEPEYLAVMTDYLDNHPEVGVVYCGLKIIDGDGKLAEPADWIVSRRPVPAGLGYRVLDNDNEPDTPLLALMANFQAIPTSSVYRRSTYEAAGGWNEESGSKVYEDKDLVMRCSLIAPVHYLNQYLARYRLHATNLSWRSNQGWRRHYETRWMSGSFLQRPQRGLTRRGIGFDRRVTGLTMLASAKSELKARNLKAGLRDIARGVKKLATAPLATFGI